jgi:pimeloyl-ACP methyl ester carboxylesterase
MKNMSQRHFVTLVLAITVAGCVFSTLEDDLAKLESVSHVFSGSVSAGETHSNAFVVIAMLGREGNDIAGFRMLAGPGPFELKLEAVPVYFFAFDDLNKDLRFQSNEPYGWAAGGEPVVPAEVDTTNINFSIDTVAETQAAYPPQLIDEPLIEHLDNRLSFNIGTVTPLDNPWFAEEQAKRGLWEPFAFMQDGGTGIHFLQPYDPDKIPVLFVHGISDTPHRFVALTEQLDQSRFQAWVFNYPSGLRLPMLANGLYQFLEVVRRQYRFDELHVVAHSMGGLVSRGYINMCTQNGKCQYLRSYTTISTPWNGVASAKSGVEWAPTVVPVWRDLDPDSEYVTTLFDTPLPGGLPHHLLFGFRQDSIFGSESSDGVIALSSQLRPAAQDQAVLIRGYDEDHVSILSSEAAVNKVHEILAEPSQ